MTILDEVLGVFTFVGAGLEFMVIEGLLEKRIAYIGDIVEDGVDHTTFAPRPAMCRFAKCLLLGHLTRG